MRDYAKENLELLWDEYKRSLNPEEYPVDLSQKCWDNKMRNIQEVQEMVDRHALMLEEAIDDDKLTTDNHRRIES